MRESGSLRTVRCVPSGWLLIISLVVTDEGEVQSSRAEEDASGDIHRGRSGCLGSGAMQLVSRGRVPWGAEGWSQGKCSSYSWENSWERAGSETRED